MIHFYTNRELSIRLEINLARWKRWSRSFLPPDPLGGMQSGYARQYSYKELSKVFLGGFLLSHLKLTVAESQQVLVDLSPWLKKNGFFNLNGHNGQMVSADLRSSSCRLFISRSHVTGSPPAGFAYLVRHVVERPARDSNGEGIMTQTIREQLLHSSAPDGTTFLQDPFVYMVNLSPLFESMHRRLTSM